MDVGLEADGGEPLASAALAEVPMLGAGVAEPQPANTNTSIPIRTGLTVTFSFALRGTYRALPSPLSRTLPPRRLTASQDAVVDG